MPKVTDAHRESRRRQILDASIDCFAREGFHRTSMTQIIAEAGVSAGTIYLYFTSKEEIVEAIAEERHALESALASTALANPDTRQALHDLATGYLDWFSDPLEQKRRRVTVQVWAEALRNERVASIVRDGVAQRHQIADLVRERQDRGELIADVDADAALAGHAVAHPRVRPSAGMGPHLGHRRLPRGAWGDDRPVSPRRSG